MPLSEADLSFLADHHSAAMITISNDGIPKPSRVSLALIEGRIWSSGTQGRVRTKRLRRDPRCTLFVFDAESSWRGLETTVTILDGPDAPQQNLRLFREMFNNPSGPISFFGRDFSDEEFIQAMIEQERLVYEFEVHRSYGIS
jgi:Pyridoxamine 5'-phosphate oxidase